MLKKILIGAGVTIGAGLVMAATGWNFLETASMSQKFVQKSDFNLAVKIFSERNEKDHDRIKAKLDKIYDILIDYHKAELQIRNQNFGSRSDLNNSDE